MDVKTCISSHKKMNHYPCLPVMIVQVVIRVGMAKPDNGKANVAYFIGRFADIRMLPIPIAIPAGHPFNFPFVLPSLQPSCRPSLHPFLLTNPMPLTTHWFHLLQNIIESQNTLLNVHSFMQFSFNILSLEYKDGG